MQRPIEKRINTDHQQRQLYNGINLEALIHTALEDLI